MKKITVALFLGAVLNGGIMSCQNSNLSTKDSAMQVTLSTKSTSRDSELLPGMKNPPLAGSNVEFTYQPKNNLEDAENIKGLVYLYTDYKWTLDDLKVTKEGALYKCSFNIPKDCAFLAIKFYANTPEGIIYDTNEDEGYIFTTVDSENQKVPGSDVAWGTFRNANLNSDFGQYFKDFSITDEASEFWVKKEIQEHPDNFPLFVDTYFKIAKLRKPEKFDTIASMLADQFLKGYPDLTENQYAKMQRLYAYDLKNKKIGDSLQELILTRFPKGYTAALKAFQDASQISDESTKIKKLEEFLKEYPVTEYDGEQPFFFRVTYNLLFENYFVNKQYDKLSALLPQMKFANLIEGYHFTISKAHHFKSTPLPILDDLSKAIISELQFKIYDLSYMSGLYWSPEQALDNAIDQFDRKLKVQMRISNDMKNSADVIKYGNYRSDATKYKDSEINEIYIKALRQEQQDIEQSLKISAANNALTPYLKDLLKQIYIAKNGNDTGFEAYLDSFKKDEFKAEINDKLINKDAPELIFENSKEEEIKISSEGKIIILDFWANWCAPCKKSFPAMQQLVEKYQNDKKVAFYFINTSETIEDYKQVSNSYLKENQLENLTVLFDKTAENARTNKMTFSKFATLFNSSGIPRKVVIKDGKIRFTSEGYSGNPDELKDEMNAVIDLLKAEN